MKFGKLLVVGLALGFVCCGAAQAQLSVYGLYQAQRNSGIPCEDPQGKCSGATSNAEGAVTTTGNSHVNTTGGWGGLTYDFRNVGPVRLGLDLRAGEGHSNKSAASYSGGPNTTSTQDVLVGVKGTFHTPVKIVRPYVQVSVGWARSNVAEKFAASTLATSSNPNPVRTYDSFIQYKAFAGVDLKIFPILDFRVVELGIGNMNMIGGSSTAVTNSVGLKSIATGIVFHLPRL